MYSQKTHKKEYRQRFVDNFYSESVLKITLLE